MTATDIDYVSRYFEIPTLTKLHGEPTYESLQYTKYEIKANAAILKSDLRGVNNGHIGLVLNPKQYTLVHVAAYICLQQPTALNIPQGTVNIKASRICSEYADKQRQ